jgi:hypothetical protein
VGNDLEQETVVEGSFVAIESLGQHTSPQARLPPDFATHIEIIEPAEGSGRWERVN